MGNVLMDVMHDVKNPSDCPARIAEGEIDGGILNITYSEEWVLFFNFSFELGPGLSLSIAAVWRARSGQVSRGELAYG